MTNTAVKDSHRERIHNHARLFDTAEQAVIGTTTDGIIIYWNRAAERIYGWAEGEVMGRDVLDVTPTDASLEQAREIMAAIQAGRSWTGEFTVRGKDGEPFRTRVSDLPVEDAEGELIGIVGVSWPVDTPEQGATG